MRTVLRALASIFGLLLLLSGLLWVGQGTGLIMWPASSFMLADRTWAFYGAITALVGALLLWWALRRRR